MVCQNFKTRATVYSLCGISVAKAHGKGVMDNKWEYKNSIDIMCSEKFYVLIRDHVAHFAFRNTNHSRLWKTISIRHEGYLPQQYLIQSHMYKKPALLVLFLTYCKLVKEEIASLLTCSVLIVMHKGNWIHYSLAKHVSLLGLDKVCIAFLAISGERMEHSDPH